jgi:hypothetical protein
MAILRQRCQLPPSCTSVSKAAGMWWSPQFESVDGKHFRGHLRGRWIPTALDEGDSLLASDIQSGSRWERI